MEVEKILNFQKLYPFQKKIGGGSLAGEALGIAKAVNDLKSSKDQLKESERHYKMMKSIALAKGIFLAPFKN